MSGNNVVIHVRVINGEPMVDAVCMSLLFGVDEADIKTLPVTPEGTMPIPKAWIQRGRQRAREAQAHTGGTGMLDALHYWAAKDRGADLTVIYE